MNQKSRPGMTKGYLDRDGFRMHYVMHGEGEHILVIGSAKYYPRTFSVAMVGEK